jgi:hypothetical protein
MQKIDGRRLLDVTRMLASQGQSLLTLLEAQPSALGPHRKLRFPDAAMAQMIELANASCDLAKEHNLPAAVASAERLITEMTNPGWPFERQNDGSVLQEFQLRILQQAFCALPVTIRDELNGRQMLLIEPRHADHFKQSEPLFGPEVDNVFRDAADDISEAGKCLALGRSTSTVFHLMRAMESAVKVIGQKIGATVTNDHDETIPWGVIGANIKVKIDQMTRGAEQDEWYKIHALLHSVNRSFRTKTAHPTGKYTPEEANNAFNATKNFMHELAEKCR